MMGGDDNDHTPPPPPLLWAFPGSGAAWVRLLLEYSTGYYTGSIARDPGVVAVLPGEGHGCDRGVLCLHADAQRNRVARLVSSPIKYVCNAKVSNLNEPFSKVVVLVRNRKLRVRRVPTLFVRAGGLLAAHVDAQRHVRIPPRRQAVQLVVAQPKVFSQRAKTGLVVAPVKVKVLRPVLAPLEHGERLCWVRVKVAKDFEGAAPVGRLDGVHAAVALGGQFCAPKK